jgi:hypothetical protein
MDAFHPGWVRAHEKAFWCPHPRAFQRVPVKCPTNFQNRNIAALRRLPRHLDDRQAGRQSAERLDNQVPVVRLKLSKTIPPCTLNSALLFYLKMVRKRRRL